MICFERRSADKIFEFLVGVVTLMGIIHMPLAIFLLFFLLPLGLFKGSASIDADFIRVDVVTNSGERKTDVHMHVFPKQEVLERPQKPVGIPLNVALVMFDSTSAANFVRKMPSSLEYLNKSLGSVFMQGKVTCIWVCWAVARRFAHRGHAGGKICDRLGRGSLSTFLRKEI